jgi:hypothetical protein
MFEKVVGLAVIVTAVVAAADFWKRWYCKTSECDE